MSRNLPPFGLALLVLAAFGLLVVHLSRDARANARSVEVRAEAAGSGVLAGRYLRERDAARRLLEVARLEDGLQLSADTGGGIRVSLLPVAAGLISLLYAADQNCATCEADFRMLTHLVRDSACTGSRLVVFQLNDQRVAEYLLAPGERILVVTRASGPGFRGLSLAIPGRLVLIAPHGAIVGEWIGPLEPQTLAEVRGRLTAACGRQPRVGDRP
jgi:hypothetical protein